MPVKTAVEVEEDLKKEYEKKLRVDYRLIPDPFKNPHGWLQEDEGMTFWPVLLYPDVFNYLMFYPTRLGSTDFSDYKNLEAYSYYKSGWFQPLYFHKLSGGKYRILKGECGQSLRIKEINCKFWIIMEKSGKTRSCHVHPWLAWASLVTMLQLLCIELKQQSEMDRLILPGPAQQINSFQTTRTFNR